MEINGKEIANKIINHLKEVVKKENVSPKLVVFSVRPTDEDLIYISLKKKAATTIGADFEVISYKKTPRFEEFANVLRNKADSKDTTGLIIQRPLPSQLASETLFNYVPLLKEIEGHKAKSPFFPPLGLGVFTMLKYIYNPGDKKIIENVLVNPAADMAFFKQILRRKKIVLMGRGETGGKPIGKMFSEARINYLNTHSKTASDSAFYKEADIIITAVGKKVLTKDMVKPGVILLNVGYRRDRGIARGDYDEEDITDLASFYTPTPGGIGPLEIAYLMYNLVESTRLQKKA